jgi:hypothetical protein
MLAKPAEATWTAHQSPTGHGLQGTFTSDRLNLFVAMELFGVHFDPKIGSTAAKR